MNSLQPQIINAKCLTTMMSFVMDNIGFDGGKILILRYKFKVCNAGGFLYHRDMNAMGF